MFDHGNRRRFSECRPIAFPEIRWRTETLQRFRKYIGIVKAFDQCATSRQGGQGGVVEYPSLEQTLGAFVKGSELRPVEGPSAQRNMRTLPKIVLVQRLTANVQGKEQRRAAVAIYAKMGLPQLRTLAATMPALNALAPVGDPLAIYLGAAGHPGSPTANLDDGELGEADVLAPPVMNFKTA